MHTWKIKYYDPTEAVETDDGTVFGSYQEVSVTADSVIFDKDVARFMQQVEGAGAVVKAVYTQVISVQLTD